MPGEIILQIENLHAKVGDDRDPARHRPHGAARRGARHHGAERLRQEHARQRARRARRLRGDRGSGALRRQGPARPGARGARARRLFLAFQYPVEIPGVGNTYFLRTALNAVRKHRGLEPTRRDGLPRAGQREDEVRRHGPQAPQPLGQRGLLRRREEAQRDPADGGARADARRSSTRPTRGSTSTPCASSPTASTRCATSATRWS